MKEERVAKAGATVRIDMQVVQSLQGDSEMCCDYWLCDLAVTPAASQ